MLVHFFDVCKCVFVCLLFADAVQYVIVGVAIGVGKFCALSL